MNKFKLGNFLNILFGIVVFLTGIYFLFNAEVGIFTIAIIMSIKFFIEGAVKVYIYFSNDENLSSAGLLILGGTMNLIFALVLFFSLNVSAILLSFIIGIWFLISSLLRIAIALAGKKIGLKNWVPKFILGITSALLSLWLLKYPMSGVAIFSLIFSISLISAGIMLIGDSF